jgi:hypothetical protein
MAPLVALGLLTVCPPSGTALIVETAAHRLVPCEGGEALKEYRVAIGSGRVAKRGVGWAQTPLAVFTLARPRPSKQCHAVIPLVNPDSKRFSAWAIGLHGPPRETKDEGALNVSSGWTWGCIAVAGRRLRFGWLAGRLSRPRASVVR